MARHLSALLSFYKWAAKHEIVTGDPVALADKSKRPHRIPVWLEKDEQQRLEATVKRTDDLPDNIFGQKREHVTAVHRYELLFTLLLNSGLRISEALGL